MKKLGAWVFVAMATIVMTVGPALADGDPEKGKKVFRKCTACHTADEGGRNRVGPNLFGIVGRQAASVPKFRYSKSVRKAADSIGTWDDAKLDEYLNDPTKFVRKFGGKRSKMTFKLKRRAQRADVIAYLNTLK